MRVDNIALTQDNIRSKEKVAILREAINKNANLGKIYLLQTEDGKLWLRDGLHRSVAIYLYRKDRCYYDDEYIIEQYTYQQINSINLKVGYVTPFDLKNEVRVADLTTYKKMVFDKIKYANYNVEDFIYSLKNLYCVKRKDHHSNLEKFIKTLS